MFKINIYQFLNVILLSTYYEGKTFSIYLSFLYKIASILLIYFWLFMNFYFADINCSSGQDEAVEV